MGLASTMPQDKHQSEMSVWQPQTSGADASLRGLSVVNSDVAWASGTAGTVLRTTDGGQTWTSVSVPDAAQLDFRDLHAHDAATCTVVSAGTPGVIYQTHDGGRSWREVYRNDAPTIFFDAMSFWDRDHGLAVSDPQDGTYFVIRTSDGGATWQPGATDSALTARPGEACFAASGTALCAIEGDHVWLGSGGTQPTAGEPTPAARVFRSFDRGTTWSVSETPIRASQSAGIFSIAFANVDHGVAVGGDYLDPQNRDSNIAVTDNGGERWRSITGVPPGGYRSCVAILKGKNRPYFVAVGPTGTDVSADWGNNWHSLDSTGFHAVAFAPDGSAGWAVGSEGRIAKWLAPPLPD
jgi:photosystem II stability/assembly factor-like uncharacterized protein